MKTSTCRSCRAPIVFVRMTTGRRMPIDATPTPTGNVVVDERSPFGEPDAHVAGLLDDPNGTRYTSHFATCPNAGDHRKKGTA